MTKLKKLTAVLLSVIMFVCCFSVQTGAVSVFSNSRKIDSMEYYSTSFDDIEYYYYKIVLPSSGSITFRVEEGHAKATIFSSNADEVAVVSTFNGEYSIEFNAGRSWKIPNLSKGTYYLKLEKYRAKEVKNFYYTFAPDNKPTISLALNVKVGDELDFSALASNYTGKCTWKTTKSAVASVDGGTVTCKKAGKAKIRAYMNNGDYAEITLIVKKK